MPGTMFLSFSTFLVNFVVQQLLSNWLSFFFSYLLCLLIWFWYVGEGLCCGQRPHSVEPPLPGQPHSAASILPRPWGAWSEFDLAQALHCWMDCFPAGSFLSGDSGERKVGAKSQLAGVRGGRWEKGPGPESSGLQACVEACHCCSDYRAGLGQGSPASCRKDFWAPRAGGKHENCTWMRGNFRVWPCSRGFKLWSRSGRSMRRDNAQTDGFDAGTMDGPYAKLFFGSLQGLGWPGAEMAE